MPLCLVTGANGHLGNNLVRALLERGREVRASVRTLRVKKPLEGLDCQVVHADLMDGDSLEAALDGVDTLFQVAAPFRMWARKPERDIVQPSVDGTCNILDAASNEGVKKVVHVSSILTLGSTSTPEKPLTEDGWNEAPIHPYIAAKVQAERMALKYAEDMGCDIVSVLPGSMVGPHLYGHLTPTMSLLRRILANRMPVDPNFSLNIVDVRDVAQGLISAEKKGRMGERYILANDRVWTTGEIAEFATTMDPAVQMPLFKAPKPLLKLMALFMEDLAKVTRRPPGLTPEQVEDYYGRTLYTDITKARKELGYHPRPGEEALADAFAWLEGKWGG
jgi:dihydroflavonol-4-reductase